MMTPLSHPLITSVCYVRVAVQEVHAASRFAADLFGLQRVASADGEVAFRSDHRFQTVTFSEGKTDGDSIGVEVWSEAALDDIEVRLLEHDFTVVRASAEICQRRHIHSALLAQDGSGNAIDLVLRPTQSGRRYFPSRDAGIRRFHSIGLRSTRPTRDLQFWTALGAEVRDWVGDIAYLRLDGMHHRIALHPSQHNGLLYAAFEVESLDSIMQNNYFMQESQIKIVQGPGRQPCSEQTFLHVEGPDGIIFSYVYGMSEPGNTGRPARQFPLAAESFCSWGSESKDVPELQAANS
ncbi:MAG: hypothetical protein JWQ51_2831 [Tardiphaga sp.]|nr:hypothetical protein [Tardiphaga sp.]